MITGRNDKCPCGSGLKYKHCYLAGNADCKIFMEEQKQKLWMEHPSKDNKVFRFFSEAVEDIGTAFRVNESGKDLVAARVQLITVFTFIDVMASYWFEYLGENGTQQQRFNAWMNDYCLTEVNAEYKKEPEFQKLTSTRVYSFRSSMVHFLGLSEYSEGYYILIATNERPEEEIERLKKAIKDKSRPVIIIKPKKLHNLITDGATLMLHAMQKNINDSKLDDVKKWAHVHGIDRIFKKTEKEGAVKIPAKK
jgi:hypothetical protein